MQTDPIGYGDGMNNLAYVGNDAVNAIDPLGLAKTKSCTGSRIKRGLRFNCNSLFAGTGPLSDPNAKFAATLGDNRSNHIGHSSGRGRGIVPQRKCVTLTNASGTTTSCGSATRFQLDTGTLRPFGLLKIWENLRKPGPSTTPNEVDYCGSAASNSEALVPDKVLGRDLSGACRTHDKCYNTATNRLTCDQLLRRDVNAICTRITGRSCPGLAGAFYAGVRIGGRFSYEGTGKNN